MPNALSELTRLGQSIWYDNIRRGLVRGGELARLVVQDEVRGVTSNPAIFQNAIAGSTDYDEALRELGSARDQNAARLYEALAIDDVQQAADVLRPTYDRSEGRDGFVSLEVSPYLAHDTEGTICEALRLWGLVARPNAMIKIPATAAGIAALPAVVGEGVNTNVTLLFSRRTFEEVARAHWDGLEQRLSRGLDISRVASVASFFVSRIDSAIQARIVREKRTLPDLRGSVAVSNAKLVYKRWHELHASSRWSALAARGAQPQRLLWASTAAKDPAMRDVVYVEELIGPFTVNTMPTATLDAFRDHGVARPTLEADLDGAAYTLAAVERAGISLEQVATELLAEGLSLFSGGVRQAPRSRGAKKAGCARRAHQPPGDAPALRRRVEVRRVRRGVDPCRSRSPPLGARRVPLDQRRRGPLDGMAQRRRRSTRPPRRARRGRAGRSNGRLRARRGPRHGRSSLCPDVLRATFGHRPGWPRLLVLDSTDPAQVADVEERIDLERTLFVVSSKSGTTLEPDVLLGYFFDRVASRLGAPEAGSRFVAITDPGSPLEEQAMALGFRATHYGVASIGARYSALSNFGMIPAAAMGLGAPEFLERAADMLHACAACVPRSRTRACCSASRSASARAADATS